MKYLILILTFLSICYSALGSNANSEESLRHDYSIEHDCSFKKVHTPKDILQQKKNLAHEQNKAESDSMPESSCEDDCEHLVVPAYLYRKLLILSLTSQSLKIYNNRYHFLGHNENFRPPCYS